MDEEPLHTAALPLHLQRLERALDLRPFLCGMERLLNEGMEKDQHQKVSEQIPSVHWYAVLIMVPLLSYPFLTSSICTHF